MEEQDLKELHELSDRLEDFYKEALSACCGKQGCEKCCSGCSMWNAHFRHSRVLDDIGDVKMIVEFNACEEAKGQLDFLKKKFGWDVVMGFCTEEGCRLPRWLRSCVCLSVVCKPLKKYLKLDKKDMLTIGGWVDRIKAIRKKYDLIY